MPTESLDAIYEAAKATPSDIYYHLPKLSRLGRGKVVVEIGVRSGKSTAAFLAGNCDKLVSIDINKPKVSRVLTRCTRWQFVQGHSQEVPLLEHQVLFIDGDHSYDAVLADLVRWAPYTKESIALHDTHVNMPPGFDVMRAVDDFLKTEEGQSWEVGYDSSTNNGLTILDVKLGAAEGGK